MDDYLDVFGDQAQFGKKHAGDIYENKKTVLYLLAREHATDEERKELDYWYSKKQKILIRSTELKRSSEEQKWMKKHFV